MMHEEIIRFKSEPDRHEQVRAEAHDSYGIGAEMVGKTSQNVNFILQQFLRAVNSRIDFIRMSDKNVKTAFLDE